MGSICLRSSLLALAVAALVPATAGADVYHGTVVPGANPAKAPANAAIASTAPQLDVTAHSIGANSGEPTIAVDKKGAVYFPADNFDNADGVLAHTNLLKSTNNGRTWKDVSPKVGGQDTHQKSLDTYMYLDRGLNRLFFGDLLGVATQWSRSDDGGATWNEGVASALGVNDHETLITAPPPAGFSLPLLDPAFPKLVYYCANTVAEVTCARSLDGGRSFTQMNSPFPAHIASNPPLSLLCSSLTGHLMSDRQGRIFLGSSFNSPACDGSVHVATSQDAGQTWSDSLVTDKILNAEHEVTLATDSAGTLYATWDDALHHLPYLAVSKDHGATWGKPIMIAPPGVHESNFPTIDASEPGHVAIGFPGSKAPSSKDTTRAWQYYMVVTTDATSADPTFFSASPTLPPTGTRTVHRGDCSNRCGGMFDFLDIKIAPTGTGRAWASLSDDCTGKCVTDPKGASSNPSPGLGFAIEQTGGPVLGAYR